MPFGSVTLIPGVNIERTPTLLKTGYAATQLVRFRDGLGQKLGGWTRFYQNAVAGVPRDLHGWEDLNEVNHLLVGTTAQLAAIANNQLTDITPQTLTSDFAPNFTTTNNSTTVSVIDPNINDVTTYDTVYFNVPVSQGGIILSGLYAITEVTGTHAYNITAATAATSSQTNPTVTNNTTAAGNATLHIASVPAWVVAGMLLADLTTPSAIPAGTRVQSTTSNTIVMTANAAGTGVGSGDSIVISSVPVFTTSAGSAIVSVFLVAHGLAVGDTIVFPIATTGDGVTIQGNYKVTAVADANDLSIGVGTQGIAGATFVMNNGDAELVYYLNIGPPPAGAGYGLGGYGTGGYGTGVAPGQQTGTEINATDWTSDNWGEIALACPAGGGVYQYDPTSGFLNAGLVATAPPFNGGIFVSTALQILVCWGSTVSENIGVAQDPLLVAWSTIGDYTDFQPLATNLAGNYRIPTGSKIMGGMAIAQQNLIWTDLDCWTMNFIGAGQASGNNPVFGFTKYGAGAGLISSHAAMPLRGNVYWMGPSNFYSATSGGVQVMPCEVWDFVYQNLNTAYQQNVRAMPNTPFNEAGWAFPSTASSNGENDSYVKVNITEPGAPWDYGSLPRSAWIDQSVLGMPLGTTPGGLIYQHETSFNADGQPLSWTFTTGYFFLAEGEDFVFVDQILPDFRFGYFNQAQTAQVQMSFNVLNYPGDSPNVYGPFTVTESTEWLSVRFRGRQMSITVAGSDLNSFVRLGRIRYRYGPAGRR